MCNKSSFLNKLYDLYDQQLNNDIDNANKKIDDVKEDNITTLYEIIFDQSILLTDDSETKRFQV